MTAIAWSQPNINQGYPSDDNLGYRPVLATGLENPWFTITIEWDWPDQDYWSQFCIVRSVRSPAKRVEEGQVLIMGTAESWSHYNDRTRRPIFQDPQPPSGEWTYYSIFCLNENKVWTFAGTTLEIAPSNHGWSLRLPELLPGVALNSGQGVADPADQSNDLVQFLQTPAFYLDRAVTMGETLQYFWDPMKCPPHILEHLAKSWGYQRPLKGPNSVGIGPVRGALRALRSPAQGSLMSIQEMVTGATGYLADVQISNNLMLDTNDSSFETGTVYDSGWGPVYSDPSDPSTFLEIRSTTGQTVKLPPNVMKDHYLFIPEARTIHCAYSVTKDQFHNVVSNVDGFPDQTFDPVANGIPTIRWTTLRMGVYAVNGMQPGTPNTTSNTLAMGMDFYNSDGVFVRRVVPFTPAVLTDSWERYGNWAVLYPAEDEYPAYPIEPELEIPTGTVVLIDRRVLDHQLNWYNSERAQHDNPQLIRPVKKEFPNEAGIELFWNPFVTTRPSGTSAWGLRVKQIAKSGRYSIHITVNAPEGAAAWRLIVMTEKNGSWNIDKASEWVVPDGTNITQSFVWVSMENVHHPRYIFVGVEAERPPGPADSTGGWAIAKSHLVTDVGMELLNSENAYGVPWIQVTDASSVDLVVVDDG
jgi:hypothetical protein